jgi:hypothetical protein
MSKPVEDLTTARMQLVRQRRNVAEALTAPYKQGHTEALWRVFVELQSVMDAVDRAEAHENYLRSMPPDFLQPVNYLTASVI